MKDILLSLLKIILELLGFSLLGWQILSNFKFTRAFFLFLCDLKKLDRHKFRKFGFWLYCGLGGSGKTLSMVEYMARMKRKYPLLKIYTNFNCSFADGIINSWEDIVNLENYTLEECSIDDFEKLQDFERFVDSNGQIFKKVHQGIIFGFDEIHLTFASQNFKNAPDNMLEYISQQRKLHKQIVASSQVFNRVDIKLREQTNFVIECNSLFMGRYVMQKFYHTSEYVANGEKMDSGIHKRRIVRKYTFLATDYIRDLYDTFQIMVNLNAKSDSDIAIDLLTKNILNNIRG